MASASATSAAPTEAATAITTISRLSEYGILCERLPDVPATAYDSIIVIKVTEESVTKEFPVYRGVLCFHSEFFKRALSDRWKNGSASVYNIEDTKIAIFQMFFNWMNTDHLPVDKKSIGSAFGKIVAVYKFADFYLIPGLKNRAMEAFFHFCCEKRQLGHLIVASIYEHTTQHDLFRKLALDIVVDCYKFATLSHQDDAIQDKASAYEFLKDVIIASVAKNVVPGRGYTGPSWEKHMAKHFCAQYHYHGSQDTEVAPEPSANNSSPTTK